VSGEGSLNEPTGQGTPGATTWVAVGAAFNGLAAFGFQVVGTRSLGPVAYAPVGVLWTLQYLWIAVAVAALEAYVIRLETALGTQGGALRRFLRLFARWILAMAVSAMAVSWMLRASLFDGVGDLAVVLGLVVLAYGWYGVMRGQAAGLLQFRVYALATATESILRFGAAIVVLAIGASTRSLAWVFPLGPLVAVLVFWPRLGRRGQRRARAQRPAALAVVDSGRGTRFLLATSTANAVVQFLLAGGPLVLLPLGADAVTVAVFFTMITAARVPMTFALNGGLSRFLPPLTRLALARDAAGLRRASLQFVAAIVAAAALAGGVTGVIGPELIALIFGAAFRPSTPLAVIVVIGMVLGVGGLFLAQFYIATGRETRLPATWLGALVVAGVLVALLPGPPELRVAGAFAIATGCGVISLSVPLVKREKVL
jgi:O-antigen/teichoic acid export membrane protein